jgi:hypothetical protein
MGYFRFENMDIWIDAIAVSDKLLDYSDKAEERRFFKFAEQLRAASMSISGMFRKVCHFLFCSLISYWTTY